MIHARRTVPALCSLAMLVAAPASAQRVGEASLPLTLAEAPWTGDLDGMIERRMIRVLVAYSKTFYFIDRGTQRGTTYETFRKYEEDLNRGLKSRLRVNVVFIPVPRDRLLPALVEGRGDIAAANLTITPERSRTVDFARPVLRGVREVVVTGARAPAVASVDGLAGRAVFVRRSSSYHESLLALNARLRAAGKRPVRIKPAPEQLEDEDLLEMANAGLVDTLIVDSHKAAFWAQIFESIKVHEDVAVRTGGDIAWALRKGSPKLRASLDAFARGHGQGTEFGNVTFRRYLQSTSHLQDATSEAELRKFRTLVELFRKYADRYGFDWLMLAALGYQESRLDQSVRSPAGAIGVMQLMPDTGRAMRVGDIRRLEPNIHAGVKYVRHLLDTYLDDAGLDPLNRHLLAFAAYNVGPGRLGQLRDEARRRGLDRDVWFDNVERVAARVVGQEPVRYVSNIYKYYVAYALVLERSAEREAARRRVR